MTAIMVAAPVIAVIALAMNPAPDLWRDLIAYVLPRAMLDTALLLFGVGALALVIGAGTAWLISLHDFPGRALLLWLMPLPLAIPTYIAAYVYADLFEPLGLVHRMLAIWFPLRDTVAVLPNLRSMPGAIIVIGLVLYPYVYLSARTMFQFQSAEFAEAARTLGASRLQIFFRVSLPMARPALAVGVALVSLETLNDIGASEYLGVRTLTVSIFTTWLNRGSLAGAAQLSCFMLAIVAGLIAIERYGRRNVATGFSAESPRLTPRTRLHGRRGWWTFAACLTPVLLGFIVPVLFLLQQSFKRGLLTNFDMTLGRDAFNSVAFATLATLIALFLGFATILAWRWRPDPVRLVAMSISQTGYALPGLVLALGLLTPVLAIDNGLSALGGWLGGSLPGLFLVGSGAAVVIAYVIRFLAVPTGLIKAGFERIPHDYDDSARAAGARQSTTMRLIHLPLLRPAMLGAVIIVFVDCLKELPATLLLRPLNVETLATSIYQFASRGSFEDGALAALLIVAASIGPVAWLTRFSDVPSGPA
ncbi:iron ABC transporter permease [Bradyrhizobium sp. AUGA SZCCT0160]|uniref:ABC transporter permease n=1 Tax=Bradyrhizobium sp. AUGA SZCCT0160 TaxID=2807662 RepID=UPI001BACB237|nr:iron ABC transporter permease [Bradyrhizobium sp. AUGA SZCCT0160]MBR1191292.1 iron ABC transporter permease [Bradyrhizobium sp. AUGA SZCCT0160]